MRTRNHARIIVMKAVNFIKPVPEKRKKEIRSWLIFTTILVGSLSVYVGISLLLYGYVFLTTESGNQYDVQFNSLKEAQRQKEQFALSQQKIFEKLHRYQHNPKSPQNLIADISRTVGTSSLLSFSLTKHQAELVILAPIIKQAQTYVTEFEKIPLVQNVQLTTLAHTPQGYRASYRFEYTKKRA